MRCGEVKCVAVPAVDISKLGVTNPCCILKHSVKYGLKIAGEAADNLKHLRRRCLLLQRLGEV